MRRIKGTYILIPLFCTLLCIGCDNEDTTLMPTQPIGFSTSVDDSDTHAATRTEATTANLTEIGVHAYFTGTSDFTTTGFAPNLLCNQSVKKENGTWTYDPVKYWPANPNDKVSFFAYAPHSASLPSGGDQISVMPSTATNNGKFNILYRVVKGESDLLLSLGELNRTNNHGPVRFTMKHALTKVIFKAKVEGGGSRTITGVRTQCAYVAMISNNDSNTGIEANFLTDTKTTCEAPVPNITAGSTATTVKEFFLPSKHMTDTKVSLSYLDGSTTKAIETILPNPTTNDWILGKAIGYTFTIKGDEIISIAVDAGMAWDAQEKPKPILPTYNAIIKTAEDLVKFRNDVNNGTTNMRAIQIADIDLANYTDWFPIGTYYDPFSGEYHGNGYAIKNLTVRGSYIGQDSDVAGLFGYVDGAFLTGIHLRDANVTITGTYNSYPPRCVGTLLGEADGTTQITSCSATGKIGTVACRYDDNAVSPATGGLIGSGAPSFISFCYADVNIGEDGIYAPKLYSNAHYSCTVGGFIGNILTTSSYPGCNIAACRSLGNIKLERIDAICSHTINVGGFVGSDTPSGISNIGGSYSMGNITISFVNVPNSSKTPRVLNTGGFIGVANSLFQFRSCYSYTSIALTYDVAKNAGAPIGDLYFGGFAGNVGSCTPKNCYGNGSVIPSSTEFPDIHSYEFSPKVDTFTDCFSNSSLTSAGKTVQEIVSPSTPFGLPYKYHIIEYDPSTNSYFTEGKKEIQLGTDRIWKKTPANTAYPEINYDILNITP